MILRGFTALLSVRTGILHNLAEGYHVRTAVAHAHFQIPEVPAMTVSSELQYYY